jgi:hypothetical protein
MGWSRTGGVEVRQQQVARAAGGRHGARARAGVRWPGRAARRARRPPARTGRRRARGPAGPRPRWRRPRGPARSRPAAGGASPASSRMCATRWALACQRPGSSTAPGATGTQRKSPASAGQPAGPGVAQAGHQQRHGRVAQHQHRPRAGARRSGFRSANCSATRSEQWSGCTCVSSTAARSGSGAAGLRRAVQAPGPRSTSTPRAGAVVQQVAAARAVGAREAVPLPRTVSRAAPAMRASR